MILKMGGPDVRETLTGFKWLGNLAFDLITKYGSTVNFAYEEALGYMFPEISYDKDGLTAAMVFLVALANWIDHVFTPYTKLQELYQKFGYYETLNLAFPSDLATTKSLFQKLRQLNEGYFTEPGAPKFGSFEVSKVRDLTFGVEWVRDRQNGKGHDKTLGTPALPKTPDVEMMTFWLQGLEGQAKKEVRFTLRGSGTDPKVKCKFHYRLRSFVVTFRVRRRYYTVEKS